MRPLVSSGEAKLDDHLSCDNHQLVTIATSALAHVKPTDAEVYKLCLEETLALCVVIFEERSEIPLSLSKHTQSFINNMAPQLDAPKTVEWQGKRVPVWSMRTVDYGLLLSQDPAEVDNVLKACIEDGYFYLDLNNIDGRRMLGDQQETLKLMHRFFEAPIEQKNEFGLISSHLGYEPQGSRTGAFGAGTKDGYEMLKVSRDEIQRGSPKVPSPIKNSGDLGILENSIGSCNTITKVILSALSTGMGLVGASRYENHHRNDKPSTTTVSEFYN